MDQLDTSQNGDTCKIHEGIDTNIPVGQQVMEIEFESKVEQTLSQTETDNASQVWSQIMLTPLEEVGHITFPQKNVNPEHAGQLTPTKAALYALASTSSGPLSSPPTPESSRTAFSWPNSISFNGVQGIPQFNCSTSSGVSPKAYPAYLFSQHYDIQSQPCPSSSFPYQMTPFDYKRKLSETGFEDDHGGVSDAASARRLKETVSQVENENSANSTNQGTEACDDEESEYGDAESNELEAEEPEEADDCEDSEESDEPTDAKLLTAVNDGSSDQASSPTSMGAAGDATNNAAVPPITNQSGTAGDTNATNGSTGTQTTTNERLLQAIREALSAPVPEGEVEYEEYEPMDEEDDNAEEDDEAEETETVAPTTTANNIGCLALVEDVILSYGKISSAAQDKIKSSLVGDAIKVTIGGFRVSASYVTRDSRGLGYSLGFHLDDLDTNSFILQVQDGLMKVVGRREKVELFLRIEIAAPVRIEDVNVMHNIATNVSSSGELPVAAFDSRARIMQSMAQLPSVPYYGVCPSAVGSNHWTSWHQYLGTALTRWSRAIVDIVDHLEPTVTTVELVTTREGGSVSLIRNVAISFHSGGLEESLKFNTNGIIIFYGPGDCEFSGDGILIRRGSGRTLHSGSGIVIKFGSGPCILLSNGVVIDRGSGEISVMPFNGGRLNLNRSCYQPHPFVISGKSNNRLGSAPVYRAETTGCVYVYEAELANVNDYSITVGSVRVVPNSKCNFSLVKGSDEGCLESKPPQKFQMWKKNIDLTVSVKGILMEDINQFVYIVAGGLETLDVGLFRIVVRQMIGELGYVFEVRTKDDVGSLGNIVVNGSSTTMEAQVDQNVGRLGFKIHNGLGGSEKPVFNVVCGKVDKLICVRVVFDKSCLGCFEKSV